MICCYLYNFYDQNYIVDDEVTQLVFEYELQLVLSSMYI